MFNKRKKQMAKREKELKIKKQNQAKAKKQKENEENKVKNSHKQPPQLAVTVLLDSKTGTVSVATNFESLPLTRGMLEQATDNVRQINTIRLNHLDKLAEQHAIRKQRIADEKSDKENKDAMHKQMRRNE